MTYAPELSRELSIYRTLVERIAAMNELEPDDEFVLGTAEGECDLTDCIGRIIRKARETEATVEALKELMGQARERLARFERKAKHLRSTAHYGLCEAGIKKLELPDFTVSRSAGRPSLIMTEEDANKLPDEFVRIKREPDRAAIKEALQAGQELPFAILGNAEEILTVRGR
jgi:hypothetical protein